MITAPVLWAGLLAAVPAPELTLGCDVMAYDPVTVYEAKGEVVMPKQIKAWQCVSDDVRPTGSRWVIGALDALRWTPPANGC